jgi:hypothetical protein
MSRRIILLLIAGIAVFNTNAQNDDLRKAAAAGHGIRGKDTLAGWRKGGFCSLNISNTTFSNWAAGGTDNTAGIANMSLYRIYRPDSLHYIWENYLDLAYGVVRNGANRIQDPKSPYNGKVNPFVKNEDKLVFTSKFGRKLNDKLNLSALASLNTQMFPGWAKDDIFHQNNHISNFMAQGFGYISVGLDYKPEEYFSIYVSPLTMKYTIVREQRLADLGLYGVRPAEYDYTDTAGGKAPKRTKPGQTLRTELGWYVNIFFKKDIMKNINFQSRLELFNNYDNLGQNIDVNWQNTLNMKINKYFSVSLINQLIYDYDIDTDPAKDGRQIAIQFKNFFGLGFSAKWGDPL